jgi:hypothetical protein
MPRPSKVKLSQAGRRVRIGIRIDEVYPAYFLTSLGSADYTALVSRELMTRIKAWEAEDEAIQNILRDLCGNRYGEKTKGGK